MKQISFSCIFLRLERSYIRNIHKEKDMIDPWNFNRKQMKTALYRLAISILPLPIYNDGGLKVRIFFPEIRLFRVFADFYRFCEEQADIQLVAGVSRLALMATTQKLALIGKNDFE